MIKKMFAFTAMLVSSFSFAQNTFPATGNVGIGTTTPGASLEIKPSLDQTTNSLSIKDGRGANRFSFMTSGLSGYGEFNVLEGFSFVNTGAIGSYMILKGNTHFVMNDGYSQPGTENYGMYINNTSRFTKNMFLDGKVILTGAPPANGAASYPLPTYPTTANGINVANYKLFVKGGILTEEIRVALASTWADYVFNKDYKLPTLAAVEKQIQNHGHLFNVPSAKEIAENGVELGEMAKIQQEKIEELTLYIIQQNKTNEAQNVALKIQNKEIEDLKILVKALAKKRK
jgi:hypothetical protein